MARPLRIEQAGGWYHITARGNERRPIYRSDWDREHFLEQLAEMTRRFEGRFKSVLVSPEEWGLGLSRYVHLNPVRVARS